MDAGVELYEHTPALRVRDGDVADAARQPSALRRSSSRSTRRRPAGARSRAHVTNFGSYVVLTEPVPELLEEIGWTGGEAIVDGRMFLHYFRTTARRARADGQRLGPDRISRPGGRPLHLGRRDRRASRNTVCVACLPGLADARIERAWGGPIDVSADHLPFFGTVQGKRIHYGARLLRARRRPDAGSAVRSSRRWRCGATTSGLRCRLRSRRVALCRPSRSSISAARSCGRRSSPASVRTRRATAAATRARGRCLAPAVRNGDRDALSRRRGSPGGAQAAHSAQACEVLCIRT